MLLWPWPLTSKFIGVIYWILCEQTTLLRSNAWLTNDYLLYNLSQTWLAGYYKKPTLHISSEGGVSNETKHEHEDHTEDDADMGNEAPAFFRRVL